jgi:hypothetical protein
MFFYYLPNTRLCVGRKQQSFVKSMKTLTFLRTLLILAIMSVAAPAMSAPAATYPIETKEEHATRLQKRLEEIKATDMSKLSKKEKKALRGEVKQIKKELKEISGGVYLSVGAIILIVLLIILLA